MLAASIVRDCNVRRAFPDGIFWVTVGQEPVLTLRQADLARALDDASPAFVDVEMGKAYLSNLLDDKACLVVLDDVWDAEHVKAFEVIGSRCRMLFTTRDVGMATASGAKLYALDILSDDQALMLLSQWSGTSVEQLSHEAREVTHQCGKLPLALALCGAQVRDGTMWTDLVEALREADLVFLDHPHGSVMKSLKVSVDSLQRENSSAANHYLELAIFPQDLSVPEAAVLTMWLHTENLSERSARRLLTMLNSRALISIMGDVPDRYITLHDLLHTYLRYVLANDLGAAHADLLEAYRSKSPEGWHNGPNDGYFFNHLSYHLVEAGRGTELVETAKDLRYLVAKTSIENAFATQSDIVAAETWARSRQPEDYSLSTLARQFSNITHLLLRCASKGEISGTLHSRLFHLFDAVGLTHYQDQDLSRPFIGARYSMPDQPHPALVRTLTGHQDSVLACAYSPDGVWIISASDDFTLKLWIASTGLELLTLQGHTNEVNGCVFTPDGSLVISASEDSTLKIWDVATGQELRTLQGHAKVVHGCAVSPDGRLVASASADKSVKLWRLSTGEEIRTLLGHTDRVLGCAFSFDGKRLASASVDKTVKLWDTAKGSEIRTLIGHTAAVRACAFTPDGRKVVSASADGTLKIWDAETGSEIHHLAGHTEPINGCAISPKGDWIVSAAADETLKIWDLSSGQLRFELTGHRRDVNGCAISPDGRWIASAATDRSLKIWDTAATVTDASSDSQKVSSCAISRDGGWAVTTSDVINIWSAPGNLAHTLIPGQKSYVSTCAISPNGRFLVSASAKILTLWDVDSWEKKKILRGHTDTIRDCDISPDGHHVISASADKTLREWDLNLGKDPIVFVGHTKPINACAYSPTGTSIVSASADTKLRTWDAETGQQQLILDGHTSAVLGCAFSSDGNWIVSASADKTLRIWDTRTGQQQRILEGHTSAVLNCSVSADDRWILSVSGDRSLKIWDSSSGMCLATFYANGSLCDCQMFPQSGAVLVVGDLGVYWLRLIDKTISID